MRRIFPFVPAVLALSAAALAACGDGGGPATSAPGSAGKEGIGGAAGIGGAVGGEAGAPAAAPIVAGSWDMTLDTGARFRLDIVAGDPPTAAVTSRWGDPSVLAARGEEGRVVVDGGNLVEASGTWSSFAIPVDASGNPSGIVEAEGSDPSGSALHSSGTIAPDATPPEAKLSVSTDFGAGQVILPWDPIDVLFAEPIAGDVSIAVVNQIEGDMPIPVAWTMLPPNAPTGPTRRRAIVTDWGAWDLVPRFEVGAFADASGNAGKPFSAVASIFGVERGDGDAETFDDLEPAAADYPMWGGAKQLGGTTGADPACETIACVSLGPADYASCGTKPVGFALRLVPKSPPTVLHLRVRVASDTPSPSGVPFAVQLARPAASVEAHEVAWPALTDLGDGAGELRFASAWTTLDFPVPSGTGEVGFVVAIGAATSRRPCDANAPTATGKTRVLVDSAALE